MSTTPNTYYKYYPNVYLAKCAEPHAKGETIEVETKHGKINECIVFNLVIERGGFWYYSITRADGFNLQEWAKRRAERALNAAKNQAQKSANYLQSTEEARGFLSLGEPIKIGHHSEKRHRALIEKTQSQIRNFVEYSDKSEASKQRADYWLSRANDINLSMPESIDYYEHELEAAVQEHEGLKSGEIPRAHSYSLTYAKKRRNEAENKLKIAKLLWGE